LHSTDSGSVVEDEIASGEIHCYRAGAYPFSLARDQGGAVPVRAPSVTERESAAVPGREDLPPANVASTLGTRPAVRDLSRDE